MKTILDDRHEYLTYRPNTCMWCKHFKPDGLLCLAFPKGIPTNILSGETKHNKILANQDGDNIFSQKASK